MKQDQKRYKQLPGFPGKSGLMLQPAAHEPKPVPPLSDAEREEMRKLGIPHDPEQPREYAPPVGPHARPMQIEWLGPLGLAAIVMFLLIWLVTTPASGEGSYYHKLLGGYLTPASPEHGMHGGDTGSGTHGQEAAGAH
jgi:hypothetical protein